MHLGKLDFVFAPGSARCVKIFVAQKQAQYSYNRPNPILNLEPSGMRCSYLWNYGSHTELGLKVHHPGWCHIHLS